MLKDIINKTVQDTVEAQNERQKIEDQARTYWLDFSQKADRLAADKVYGMICQQIADQIATTGVEVVSDCCKIGPEIPICSINTRDSYSSFCGTFLRQEGLIVEKEYEADHYDVFFPLCKVEKKKISDVYLTGNYFPPIKYETTLTVNKLWDHFWKALLQLAEKDHLKLEACCRISRREEIRYPNSHSLYKTISTDEQDLPIQFEPYKAEWIDGFLRSTNSLSFFLMNYRVRTTRFLSLVIKYSYHNQV